MTRRSARLPKRSQRRTRTFCRYSCPLPLHKNRCDTEICRQAEANRHDWGEHTSGPWHAANIDFSTLRLQSLCWVGQTEEAACWVGQTEETGWVPGETIRVDVYEAQVDLVLNNTALSNQVALFLSRQS